MDFDVNPNLRTQCTLKQAEMAEEVRKKMQEKERRKKEEENFSTTKGVVPRTKFKFLLSPCCNTIRVVGGE